MVIDLTIENDPDGLVFVRDRLVTGGEVDDAKAAHADADLTIMVDALVIRTAVRDYVAHLAKDGAVGANPVAKLIYSCYSTHELFAPVPGETKHGIEELQI